MKTCGFCGSKLNNNFCTFCEIELSDKYIMKDGNRLNQFESFKGYPNESEIYKSTKELMELETIHLLCLLREARSVRAETYKLRALRHQAEKQEGFTEKVKEIEEYTYKEYENATRKVWVIENIIKDRLGYYPERVTNNFLNMYLERMKQSEREQKNMIIKQSIY